MSYEIEFSGLRPCSFAASVLGTEGLIPGVKEAHKNPSSICCVCGSKSGVWKRDKAISDSFGPPESFSAPASDACCADCAYFASGHAFTAYVADKQLQIKTWAAMSWRNYSQIFSKDRGHIIPKRADIRDFLTNPPKPPFLVVLTTGGKKNILYRSKIAQSEHLFPVALDDDTIWVDRSKFISVLSDFETAYAAGFSKDSILSGGYSQASIMKVGIKAWQALEKPLAAHRAQRLPQMRLAHIVGSKPTQQEN